MQSLKKIHAGVLEISYGESGPQDGQPVFLMHGFPYDILAYAEVSPILAAAGCRVIVPYLRGFGATRFLSSETPRSGEQAALGADLLALMDALRSSKRDSSTAFNCLNTASRCSSSDLAIMLPVWEYMV